MDPPEPPRPPDYAGVVRANHPKSVGFLLAAREPCLGIRRDEIRYVRREFRALAPEELGRWAPPVSWFLAVLLCPGDGTDGVAAWAARLSAADLDRVRFYHHPAVDLDAAFAGWRRGGLPPPRATEMRDFASFHRRFGAHFNDQVYRDAVAPPQH